MKKSVLLFLILYYSILLSQNPGGISGAEIWTKVNKTTTSGTIFQYKDFSLNNKQIQLGTGSVLSNSLLNYNYSFSFDNNDFIYYQSKLESMKDATVFIVNLPVENSDPSIKYALISTDWNIGVTVPTGSINNQEFKLSTSTFDKNNVSITYPNPASTSRFNGRINTLLWHNFNSKKIFNSFGSSGESSIFVGKIFSGVVNFNGEIPEFIVYKRALNEKEKNRVESYLALKYGITLDENINYCTSKNEIFWHKENNGLFKNRIFGIGKDLNSALNQKQSTTIHDTSTLKKLIFWTGIFQNENNLNTGHIEDQNFLTIGDNNSSEIPNIILQNGIKKIDRTWLVEKFGPSIHNTNTNIKYKPDSSITLLPNEAFWLIVDKNANNSTLSNFNSTSINYYPVSNFDTNGYAVYNNLTWASDTTTYNQFTFGVGPKMLIFASTEEIACSANQGNVNIEIKGGQPTFTINVHGIDNNYNLQLNQSTFNLSLTLNIGNYQVTITDNTGYTQTTLFEISPTPGIHLELGPDQYLINGNTLNINASSQVTSSSVIYEWFKDGVSISTNFIISITEEGEYKCVITDTNTGCTVEDTIMITIVEELTNANNSSVFPNPASINNEFHVMMNFEKNQNAEITINDILGKTLEIRNVNGKNSYDEIFTLNTAGVYLIKIQSEDIKTTHKLIIN